MTIEVNPVGVKCNIRCTYCYENPLRDFSSSKKYDLSKMLHVLGQQTQEFTVFGGEPLLTPIKDLEEIFKLGLEKHGRNGIQTNGTLITERHIGLFKRYNVTISISFDGPGELNSARALGDKTSNSISTLISAGIIPSLIVTLHKLNFSYDRRELLKDWFIYLDSMKIKSIRLHLLENDSADELVLDKHELLNGLIDLYNFKERFLKNVRFDLFDEIRNLLSGSGESSCTFHACDPFTTRAVHGIDSDGTLSNCPRTNKEGINYLKCDTEGNERSIVLYNTPYEDGGCKDCRFFALCTGYCPGTAINGDWRNRSEHCSVLMGLFSYFEDLVEDPITRSPRRVELENYILTGNHGDAPHGDAPHGDSHGDHIDLGIMDAGIS